MIAQVDSCDILLLNPSIHTQSDGYARTTTSCVYRVVRYVLQARLSLRNNMFIIDQYSVFLLI